MYGAQSQDTVVINRIDELPAPVQFFIREVLKKQYAPVVAIFYQDVEPYKIDEWDDYWDGGQYEVLIVLEGDWEDEEFSEQRIHIARSLLNTEARYGDIYFDDAIVGYAISDLKSVYSDFVREDTYEHFIWQKGSLVYATQKFFINSSSPLMLQGSYVGIFGILDAEPEEWFKYAKQWFDIAEYCHVKQYYSHSAYAYRMSIELNLKCLLSLSKIETKKQHNIEVLFEKVSKLYYELDSNMAKELSKLYRKGADFRYPDSSWIPTKEDIEKFFRPTAKKILDHVSNKISQ